MLRAAARDSDGVVHMSFRHDAAFNGDFQTAVKSDLAAIEALGEALAGSVRPPAIASGIAGIRSVSGKSASRSGRGPVVRDVPGARLLILEDAPRRSRPSRRQGRQGDACSPVKTAWWPRLCTSIRPTEALGAEDLTVSTGRTRCDPGSWLKLLSKATRARTETAYRRSSSSTVSPS